MKAQYHHGDLARSLVAAAVSLLQTKGLGRLSLREVARVAGVSHGAPAHHFRDKAGLLTAVAIEGYQLLAAALIETSKSPGVAPEQQLVAAGEAYVRFAISRTAYFEVMFRPALINSRDPQYLAASRVPKELLEQRIRDFLQTQDGTSCPSGPLVEATAIALWSQVHGFATLWLAGNLGNPADTALFDKMVVDMLSSISPKLQGREAQLPASHRLQQTRP